MNTNLPLRPPVTSQSRLNANDLLVLRRMTLRRRLVKGLCLFVVLLFIFVSVFPFLWVTITSFKPSAEIFGSRTAFKAWPEQATTGNYTQVLAKGLLKAIRNSFIVSSFTTIYVIVVATLSAYLLSRYRFRGKRMLMGLILAVSMFPQMIVVGPIYMMFYRLDILNSYWVALAYASITLPTAVWIMVAHFRSIPLALEEAARIDGASPLCCLIRIIFPLAAPGVFTTAIMTFIAAWNEYLLTFTLNTDDRFFTVPVKISALRTQFTILWGEISAATVVVILPTLVIVLLFQKQIISGITSGAMKE